MLKQVDCNSFWERNSTKEQMHTRCSIQKQEISIRKYEKAGYYFKNDIRRGA